MTNIMPKTARFFKMNNTYINLSCCTQIEIVKNPDTDYWQLNIKTIDGDSYEWSLPTIDDESDRLLVLDGCSIKMFRRELNRFMDITEDNVYVFDCTIYALPYEQAQKYWNEMWGDD